MTIQLNTFDRWTHDSDSGSNYDRVGRGFQDSHWGELIQGPVDYQGDIHTALITLPRTDRFATAKFQPFAGSGVCVNPIWKSKAKYAAEAVLDRAGRHDIAGQLVVMNNILENGGGGSSTADIIAAIRATTDAINFEMSDETIQHLCWEIEGASDPLALMEQCGTVVYGSRCGQIIQQLAEPLPPMVCLGFVSSPDETVLTESLVGHEGYTTTEVQTFVGVVDDAERGIALRRADLVAKAATKSARLNQFRLETRNFDELVRLSSKCGALGLGVSHSGVVAAAIFDPRTPDLAQRMGFLADGLVQLGCDEIEPFTINTTTRS